MWKLLWRSHCAACKGLITITESRWELSWCNLKENWSDTFPYRCWVLWGSTMNWRCLRKSSRSSCLKVTQVFSVEIQPVWSCWFWASVFLCAAEMSIIEEYEKNQLFEQQYISSVVEGMDEMRIICPICHTWVWKSIALNTWQQQLVVSHFAISNWDLKRSTCFKTFSVRAVARTLSSLSQIESEGHFTPSVSWNTDMKFRIFGMRSCQSTWACFLILQEQLEHQQLLYLLPLWSLYQH